MGHVPSYWRSETRKSAGYTLIELLVVITIIGLLVSMLLPAVQSAREAARRIASAPNNVKQLGLAMLLHEHANGWLPSGGWGHIWVGDPASGFGKDQPGGFFYNCLPYLEQQALHDLSLGTARGSQEQNDLNLHMARTPVSVFSCPAHRQPQVFPTTSSIDVLVNCTMPQNYEQSAWFNGDYKANGGSVVKTWGTGPWSWDDAVTWLKLPPGSKGPSGGSPFLDMSTTNGICHQISQIRLAQITDGLANTYLVGEKYINPDYYVAAADLNGDQPAVGADDWDLLGWTTSRRCWTRRISRTELASAVPPSRSEHGFL